MNKSEKIREHFRKFPGSSVATVAAKYQASKPMTYKLRTQVRNEVEPNRKFTATASQVALAKKLGLKPEVYMERAHKAGVLQHEQAKKLGFGFTPKELVEVEINETVGADETINERAQDYGKFKDGAALMQGMKRLIADHAAIHDKTFADDQWEALEMILHKIGRIVNGNPDKVDSWVDIAGYATLVADRLQGNAR